MKRLSNLAIACFIASVSLASCAKALEGPTAKVSEGQQLTITAYTDSYSYTKTSLVDKLSGNKGIEWTSGDAISLFFNSGSNGGDKFTTTSTGEKATFSGSISFVSGDISDAGIGGTSYFWAVYPYTDQVSCNGTSVTTSLPTNQLAYAGNIADDLLIAVGRSQNTSIPFKNACSVVAFTLSQENIAQIVFSGNADEDVAGEFEASYDGSGNLVVTPTANAVKSITITPAESATFATGTTYYFVLLPDTFSSGYSLEFTKNNGATATYRRNSTFTFNASTFYTMTNKDSGLEFVDPPVSVDEVDLSKTETANSYIVTESGNYKFNATVKGNSSESVGTPASAEVLWESFGTDVTPTVGDLVNTVSLQDGYVHFKATSTKGNAVIAVKDNSDNILWSWHIWLTDQPTEQVYNNNAGTMMDRNLGATSATIGDVKALGLLYQWGRKDPFLSCDSISSSYYTQAESTLSWPSAESASSHLTDNNTLSYAVSHPTTFIKTVSSPYDWYCTNSSYKNDNLWSSTKTMYDPCPAGWRVPDGGTSGIWAKAFDYYSSWWATAANWDWTNKGMNFGSTDKKLGSGSIWYPAAGCRNTGGGALTNVGYYGYYWSCTPSGDDAYDLIFNEEGKCYPSSYDHRAYGYSVRCLSESN